MFVIVWRADRRLFWLASLDGSYRCHNGHRGGAEWTERQGAALHFLRPEDAEEVRQGLANPERLRVEEVCPSNALRSG